MLQDLLHKKCRHAFYYVRISEKERRKKSQHQNESTFISSCKDLFSRVAAKLWRNRFLLNGASSERTPQQNCVFLSHNGPSETRHYISFHIGGSVKQASDSLSKSVL